MLEAFANFTPPSFETGREKTMVNGDRNSQVFISIRKLLLGDLESGAGLGPHVPDHWSCQMHTFQAEMIGTAGRNSSCLSAHGTQAAEGCWVSGSSPRIFFFLGWLLKLL